MAKIWSDQNRFQIWLDIELHACDALAEIGALPRETADEIRKKAQFDEEKIHQLEKETRHDVIAFLTELARHVGDKARFIHQGMTSSDILDTCLGLQLKQSADLLILDLQALLCVLRRRASSTK